MSPGAGLSWRQIYGAMRGAAGLPGFLRHPLAPPGAAGAAGTGGAVVAAGVGSAAGAGSTEGVGSAAVMGSAKAAGCVGRAGIAGASGTVAAAAAVAGRMAGREAAFLDAMDRLVFSLGEVGNGRDGGRGGRGPLRRLLHWAGCERGDLRRMVLADGIEATLTRLGAAGVRISADELRGRVPLRRSGLEIATAPRDFLNPLLGGGVAGATSGSTGRRVAVRYSWPFLAAEAADEQLLLASHGMEGAPLALWLPGPPGIAGLHNLLVHAKLGAPPERWFSPSPPPAASEGLAFCADRAWRAARRVLPRLGPAAEWTPPENAERVARWLAAAPRPAVLKCFAGAALRVAAAAEAAGLDLSRHLVLAGGEPLGEARRAYLARTGLRVYARYAATEAGFLAGACPHGESGADMHVYSDRVALVGLGGLGGQGGQGGQGGLGGSADLNDPEDAPPTVRSTAAGSRPLAVTSLTLEAPMVLLNAELGDHGTLRRQGCDCALGRAGLSWRVNDVHSPAKIGAEGVKLGEVDLLALLDDLMRSLGGSPDDFQIRLGEGDRLPGVAAASGAARLTIALAPHSRVEADDLVRRLKERLPVLPGGALAAKLWFASGALVVERRPLFLGPGEKTLRVVR